MKKLIVDMKKYIITIFILFAFNLSFSQNAKYQRVSVDTLKALNTTVKKVYLKDTIIGLEIQQVQKDTTKYGVLGIDKATGKLVKLWNPISNSDTSNTDTSYWLNPIDEFAAYQSCAVEGKRVVATSTGSGWIKDYIYECIGSSWIETTPLVGNAIYCRTDSSIYTKNFANWTKISGLNTAYYADTSYAHIVANRPNKLDTIFKNIDLIANTTLFPKGTYFTINKGSYTATTNILRDSCTLEFKDGSKVTKSNSGALFRNRHFTGYSDILGLGTFVTTDTLYNCSTSDGTNGKSIIINAKSMTTSASGCIYIVSAYVTSVKFKSDVVCTGGDALNITIHGSAIVEDFSSVGITSTVGYGIKNEYNIGVNGFGFRIKGHNVTSSSAYEAIYSAFNNYWGYPVNIDVDYISGTKAIFANGYFYSGVMSRIYGNITGDINVNNTDCNISGSITNGVVYGGNTSGTLTVYSNCKNVGFVGNLVVKGAVMNDISYWTNHTFFVGFFANAKTTFDAPIVISNSNTSSNVLIDNGQYNYYPANVTFNGTVTFTGNYTYVPTVVSSGALRINNDFINLGTTTTNTMIQIYGASIRIGANAKIINNSAIAGTGCIVHNASGYWVGNNSQFCYGGIMKSTGDCIQSTTTVDVYNYQNYFANHGRSVTGIGAYVEKITGGGTEIIDADVQ